MEYANFDLWIDPQVDDYYPVRVNYLSNPPVPGKLTVASVEALRLNTADTDQPVSEAARKKLGASLFQALLSGATEETYRTACKLPEQDSQPGLRIRLRIAPPEVAAVPWELLYDEKRNCFLSTSTRTMLTRFIKPGTPRKKVSITPPLRILVVIPKSLESSKERRVKIANCLKDLGDKIEVRILEGKATRANIDRELSLNDIHIIHFVGDGVVTDKEACLLLDDQNSEGQCSVTAKEFSYYFEDYPPLRLIVLQACASAKTSTLRCVAEELVQLGLAATICIRGGISDDGIKTFAQAFYPTLREGYARGLVDVAVSHARKRIIAQLSKSLAFAYLILFMCADDGEIFEFNEPVPVRPSSFSSAIRMIAVGLILSLLVFVGSHMKVLSRFWIDDYVSGGMRWVASRPEGALNRTVMLIVAEQDKNGDLGSVVGNVEWRKYHANLLDGFTLVERKPKIIVLDLRFDLPEPTNLDKLATAIGSAQNQKIRVVAGQEIDEHGHITPKSILPKILKDPIGDSWGDAEVGGRLDLPLVAKSIYINEYKIASLPPGTPTPAPEIEVVPSLALKAVMAYLQSSDQPLKAYFDEYRSEVVIKESNGSEIKRIPVVRKVIDLEMLMKYVPNDSAVTNTTPYANVHKWAVTAKEQSSKENLEKMFSDSIVIIGYNTVEDTRNLIGDEPRSGVQIHANAISNVLNDVYFRHISGLTDLTVIIVMMSMGILLQTVFKPWLPANWNLSLPVIKNYLGEIPVPLSLLVTIAIYLLIGYLVFARSHYSFEMAYHLLALLLGFLFIAIFRNRLGLSD